MILPDRKQGIYRVVYITKYLDTIFVLHAFQKKTRKTAQNDINLAKGRLKEVLKKVDYD